METTNQWIRFARLTLKLGRETLPPYAQKFSPRRFTLPQLAACVLLKEFHPSDWRGIQELLALPSELRQLLTETVQRVPVRQLYADGAYDAEWVHVWCREQNGIQSWIPPTVHRRDGQVGGHWRSRMAKGLPKRYGRRWSVESFISAMRQKLGADVRARHRSQQLKEALGKVLAYSIHR